MSFFLPGSLAFAQGSADFQKRKTWAFAADGVSFSNEFSGARLNGVTRTGKLSYQLSISPEARPINDSAWFAFRVCSERAEEISLTISYEGGTHRYRPQVSREGGAWRLISGVTESSQRRTATFPLEVSPLVQVVAGQPLITMEDQMAWAASKSKLPFVSQSEIGRSVQGRPVPMLETKTATAGTARTLILMTGQHPPEFTSVVGFRNFMEPLLGDTPLALEFRRHFNMAIFPLMNPDGWYHGHWRCNANGIDPNRSWTDDGLAKVPEVKHGIRVIRGLIDPVLFIDFHSTKINVLYTGPDDDREPRFIVPELHEALGRRVPEWLWKRDISHKSDGPPSRSWATRVLNIPSVTWEFSDIAGARRLEAAPVAGAEELMRLLLRLVSDDTRPLARFDFEPAGIPADSEGGPPLNVVGKPKVSASAAVGSNALSFAPAGSYLTLPDFDYASQGTTLSFWFRMDQDLLASGDVTSLYSHGGRGLSDSLNVFHRKSTSDLRVLVRDANDGESDGVISLPEDLVTDGKWHHLGVVVRPGAGTAVFLNGIFKGEKSGGNDGINPEGTIFFGADPTGDEASRFRGGIDDFRIYGSALRPYDLTCIRLSEISPTRTR